MYSVLKCWIWGFKVKRHHVLLPDCCVFIVPYHAHCIYLAWLPIDHFFALYIYIFFFISFFIYFTDWTWLVWSLSPVRAFFFRQAKRKRGRKRGERQEERAGEQAGGGGILKKMESWGGGKVFSSASRRGLVIFSRWNVIGRGVRYAVLGAQYKGKWK